ncbi:HNH endonuclease [uncultured Paenibacillus sp.]|uniref:HNH endonuclease n=1 Tax=uncultured Paenibacillus sp. TaxID=227322 RepID=UPI00205F8C44|nr:HNH endonuclease [uncultured Paenibacillus sp.]DAW22593.1 MAG TPA: HNH endonuclease [Caudoviricetes sp.]
MVLPLRRVSEDYKNEAWLRKMYVDERKSRRQIGDICGVNENTIRYYMSKFGISARRGKDRMTESVRAHLSCTNSGRTPWNAGLAGSYQPWTKHGKDAPGYKGGVVELVFDGLKYRKVLTPKHPYADANGYVFEHRLVCERVLGRFLDPNELVHHRDGDSLNNDPANLFIFYGNSDHMKYHFAKKKNPELNEEVFCNETGCKYISMREVAERERLCS